MTRNFLISGIVAAMLLAGSNVAGAQIDPSRTAPSYADRVDLVLAGPVVADVQVRRATRLGAALAPDVAPGFTRFLIEADVLRLIRAPDGVPGQVRYVVDLANDARGRPPRVARRARYLVLAQPVPGRPGQLKLAAPTAQFAWTADEDARLRAIIAATLAPDAPPQVTGITSAFHVPGAIPGESETQIFLRTADERPISLTVLRRPGETPAWAVALGELTDEAARPPARDTLLWYRLACALPATLPATATADLGETEAAAARQDYQLVITGLGRCDRNLQKEASSTPTPAQSG